MSVPSSRTMCESKMSVNSINTLVLDEFSRESRYSQNSQSEREFWCPEMVVSNVLESESAPFSSNKQL